MANSVSESADNKIEYGLCNVYYALITGYNEETKKYTYAAPVRIPGGVSVSFSASGDSNPFYADNIVYYNTKTNAGYEGDLEIATIPDNFRTGVLGELEIDGMLVENSDAQGKEFALMFQFEGDVSGRRHEIADFVSGYVSSELHVQVHSSGVNIGALNSIFVYSLKKWNNEKRAYPFRGVVMVTDKNILDIKNIEAGTKGWLLPLEGDDTV